MLPHEKTSSDLLGCFFTDAAIIDKAIQAGITPAHFPALHEREQFKFLCELRLEGKEPTPEVLFAEGGRDMARLARMGGFGGITAHQSATTLHAPALIAALLDIHAKRESWKVLTKATESLAAGTASLDDVKDMADQASALCSGQQCVSRSLNDVDAEVEAKIKAAQSGKVDESKIVRWGLPKMDKFMLPIERHEFVLVCARPSRGKSSLLSHLAGVNLKRNLKVAIFTLETSDTSVFMQIAGQYAGVNLKKMAEWMPEEYRKFNEARAYLKNSKRLLIFDKDLTLEALESRCRLLAGSFKPDLVIGDYLGLVRTTGKDIYERVSKASKAMIPLRKALGCPLVFGQQLKRLENEKTKPDLSDLRDSGQLEEDSSRVVMLHWTESQNLDQEHRPYVILQPKFRDGPTTSVNGIVFHTATTTFREAPTSS